jgi:hypothetical protein
VLALARAALAFILDPIFGRYLARKDERKAGSRRQAEKFGSHK